MPTTSPQLWTIRISALVSKRGPRTCTYTLPVAMANSGASLATRSGIRLFAMPGAPPLELPVEEGRRTLLEADVIGAGDDRPGRDLLPERSDRIERHDVLEPEIGQRADVGPVVDRMRRQGEPVSVAVDQRMVAARLVGDRAESSLDRAHVPGRKERGIDYACAA